MYKKLITILFFGFLFFMLIGNSVIYLSGSSETEIQTEDLDDSSYLKAMEQTKLGKYFFINMNGIAQNMLNRQVIHDSAGAIVKLNNGHLMSASQTKDVTATVNELEKTKIALEQKDIPMLWIGARVCPSVSGTELPTGSEGYEYDNEVINTYLAMLNERSIPYIDTYDVLSQNDCKWEENFYKTDHHWTTEAAFRVFQETCTVLNEEYNMGINDELFNRDSYEIESYPQSFLGSEGRRVGKYYAGLDDFELLYPGYDTEFTLEIPDKAITREGTFQEAVLNPEQDLGKYGFDDNPYYKYLGGDYPLVKITNHKQENSKKIMIVKDSFGIPVSSFLSLVSKEISIVDIRYSQERLIDFIDRENPDIVIFCYGPGYLGWPGIVELGE